MRERSVTPGLNLLMAICGGSNSASFLALGDVFSEVMTSLIMFQAIEIGRCRGEDALPSYTVPLVTDSIGALDDGYPLQLERLGGRRWHAFIVLAVMIAIAALLAQLWDSEPRSSLATILL